MAMLRYVGGREIGMASPPLGESPNNSRTKKGRLPFAHYVLQLATCVHSKNVARENSISHTKQKLVH